MLKKYLPLRDVLAKLCVPGKPKPMSKANFDLTYHLQLGIILSDSAGNPRTHKNQLAYISQADSKKLREAFEANHWKKFAASEVRDVG